MSGSLFYGGASMWSPVRTSLKFSSTSPPIKNYNRLAARPLLCPCHGRRPYMLGVVAEFGDWRSKLNWGGVSVFTARLVDLNTGQVVWSVSANRNLAHVNAAGATHAGAESAVRRLEARLRPSPS